MKLDEGFDSNFHYVLVAARRARQLQNGSKPLVASSSNKASRVAQDEIAAGKVKVASSQSVLDPAASGAPEAEHPAEFSTDVNPDLPSDIKE